MAEFGHREIELSLREDGSRRVFLLRSFSLGDEQGIYDCVTEEYGDSYFKRDFYDVSKIKENALGEHYCFFVAETGGEIAGMEIFHIYRDEEEDYIEPASQIIRKQYRGYGLADALVDYTLPLAESMYPCALFVHAVTFHKATQAICEGYGMIPVGFRLGSFLTERMINSYEKKCGKYSEGIMVLPVGKKDAGVVFLPGEVAAFGEKIYKRMGSKYEIVVIPEKESSGRLCEIREGMADEAQIVSKIDPIQRMAIVKVVQEGKDLQCKMRELIASFEDEPDWVIQITLSISTPAIYCEYEELKKIGFFFSGLKPLCGLRERMYMQWVGAVELNMDRYELTESFDEIRRDIENFYLDRKGQGNL